MSRDWVGESIPLFHGKEVADGDALSTEMCTGSFGGASAIAAPRRRGLFPALEMGEESRQAPQSAHALVSLRRFHSLCHSFIQQTFITYLSIYVLGLRHIKGLKIPQLLPEEIDNKHISI